MSDIISQQNKNVTKFAAVKTKNMERIKALIIALNRPILILVRYCFIYPTEYTATRDESKERHMQKRADRGSS